MKLDYVVPRENKVYIVDFSLDKLCTRKRQNANKWNAFSFSPEKGEKWSRYEIRG